MTMSHIGISVTERSTPPVAVIPTSRDDVAVIGSLGSSQSAANTAIQTRFPEGMVVRASGEGTGSLIRNHADFLSLGADRGSAYRALLDLYANRDVPVSFIRVADFSDRGATLAPTDVQVTNALTQGLARVPSVLDREPRFVMMPNLVWNRTQAGNTGAARAGDALLTQCPWIETLSGQLETLEAIAVVSTPPVPNATNSRNPATADQAIQWSALNRGSHTRIVHVFPRRGTDPASDDDMSGAVLGTIIRNEEERGVGANINYARIVSANASLIRNPTNSFGQSSTDDAAELSEANVMAVINHNGLHIWGNTFPVAPGTNLARSALRFISTRRAMDEISRAMREINLEFLTYGVSDAFFDAVIASANAWLSDFAASGGIRGGSVEKSALNTQAANDAGNTFFDVTMRPTRPVRTMQFTVGLSANAGG